MLATPCYSAVNRFSEPDVLTGDIIHHLHVVGFGVAELVSLSTWEGARHLVVTGAVVERHHDVCCDR